MVIGLMVCYRLNIFWDISDSEHFNIFWDISDSLPCILLPLKLIAI